MSSHAHSAPAATAEYLERILASQAFQSSRRSQEFLSYVVRMALDGDLDAIKERTIAVQVFGRSAAYDSSEDSFVRVKAAEVRRRLARYYESEGAADPVRIEIPLGSYVPHFLPTAEPAAALAAPARRRHLLPVIAAGILFVAIAGAAWFYRSHTSALNRFWRPVLHAPGPLLIFLPQPRSYNFVSEDVARASGQTLPEIAGANPRQFVAPNPDKVGLGAAQGAIRFALLAASTGKPYTVKSGDDFTFADLRNQPCVIFGAFSSKWTVEFNNEFRFRLIAGPGGGHVTDSQSPADRWTPTRTNLLEPPKDDYAIAGRVINSRSGQTVIIAAGITTYGTQAAAEFLTEPARLEELAKHAPCPLDQGNFQVVLHTRVIGNTPGPPEIVRVHFW